MQNTFHTEPYAADLSQPTKNDHYYQKLPMQCNTHLTLTEDQKYWSRNSWEIRVLPSFNERFFRWKKKLLICSICLDTIKK